MVKKNKEQVEDILLQAHVQGKEGYLELVTVLKDFILDHCNKYQLAVQKQIELTKLAMNLDPLDEKWHDVSEYRTKAHDIQYELNVYLNIFKSIGVIIKDNDELKRGVLKKYHEIELLLETELQKSKMLDMELLGLNVDSIKKGK